MNEHDKAEMLRIINVLKGTIETECCGALLDKCMVQERLAYLERLANKINTKF